MRHIRCKSLSLYGSLAAFCAAAALTGCGSNGTNGANGSNGEAGAPGAQGDAGAQGAEGPQGEAGPQGPQGPAGEAGAQGPQGPAGEAGAPGRVDVAAGLATATKIKHLVVIFGENVSFDHYFGTYPTATNTAGTPFTAATGTPAANNLKTPLNTTAGFTAVTGVDLLNANAASTAAGNGVNAANPFRFSPSESATEDMGHNYKPEQQASDDGLMDLFPEFTGTAGPPPVDGDGGGPLDTKGQVMGYFDGNTLGTFWSLAQNYSLDDNAWTTNFGPSTPGAINLISGQTNGMINLNHSPLSTSHAVSDGNGGWTMIGDTDPAGDVCSTAADQNSFSGKNVGDLLNAEKISWGWFEGGFDLTLTNANGTSGCARATAATVPNGGSSTDYIPHHAPFQYYASTANPEHLRPSSVTSIGNTLEDDGKTTDPANHQYDSHDFFDAVSAGNFPAVSYLKAPAYQDGHPGYSDPTDEQAFVRQVITAVQASGDWESTAIVITYDDSDGWYDHQAPPIVNISSSAADALNGNDGGAGTCMTAGAQQGDGGAAPTTPLLGAALPDGGAAVPVQGRCGYGTRIPLLVISPFAKKNFIDHTLLDQTSVLKFVEDNWLAGQRIQPGGSFDTIAGSIENMFSF